MSVLDFPRIHFNGTFSTNVDTANNDDVGILISNEASVTLTDHFARMSDPQLRTWLQELKYNSKKKYVNSGWNYFGDHRVEFPTASVCGVKLHPSDSDNNDALMNSTVKLLGDAGTPPVMVDVDPTGTKLVQIFTGGFQLGDSSLGLAYQDNVVCYSRWISPRNTNIGSMGFTGAAATWQLGLTNKHLEFFGKEGSPVLSQLSEAAAAGQGVLVQFCCYLLKPLITAKDLVENYFKKGIPKENPAVGKVVGTVGVWNENEWATAPNGRRLNPATTNPPFAPATAMHHPELKVVSLNLITAIPEDGAPSSAQPPALAGATVDRTTHAAADAQPKKVDLGYVTLWVRPAGGGIAAPFGEVEGCSDYDLYFRTGGIIDVPYVDDFWTPAIESGDLSLHGHINEKSLVFLKEEPMVVDTDDLAVYLDLGDSNNQKKTIKVSVRERGKVPSIAVTLKLSLTNSTNHYEFAPLSLHLPTTPTTIDPGGDGSALVEISAATANILLLNFQPQPAGVPTFTCVRVFPADDYSAVPDEQRLSWDFVYQEVLRFYWVLFPAMVQMIDLSDEQSVVGNAEVILDRLSGVPWMSPRFMPVTRSMSAGRRKLLEDFLRSKMPAGDVA